jgi:hypothetical protein
MREYSALIILHSLIIAFPNHDEEELAETAIARADLLIELLSHK